MNIFFLNKCPIKSAKELCDKHVVKMVLETAQMCSTAIHEKYSNDEIILDHIYKPAYKNHPMTIWVRDNVANMAWAITHGLAIGNEYTYRYGKYHKSTTVLLDIAGYMYPNNFVDYNLHTKPPQCMPEEHKRVDYVDAYRVYYRTDKAHILNWTNRQQPDWI
jgi:hypothetical protein